MKRWALPLGFLIVAMGVAFYYQQHQASGRAGFPAPDFTLTDLSGRPHRLSELRGKLVFLNLWATWCPPCRDEMPSMEALFRRFKDRDFVMLAVSEDDDASAVRPFVAEMALSFPVLLDPKGMLPPRYGVTGYPETFIVDRTGQVIQHLIGPEDWDSPKAFAYFTRLLEQRPGATQDQR